MKILSAQQIREADQYTIKNESVKSIDLMERAAQQSTEWIAKHIRPSYDSLKIFCGPGNNGGDGLAIARQALQIFRDVQVYIIRESERYSEDFLINEERLRKEKESAIQSIRKINDFPQITEQDCIIDALYGTGLNKPVEGLSAQVIYNINNSKTTVVAIDIPSGLFADKAGSVTNSIVHADYTLSFECPKLSFLFAENFPFVGEFVILPIGLDQKFINSLPSNKTLLTKDFISAILIRRGKFDHKGTYGHALLITGGYGKMGAAVLASRACLRAGVGLVTAHIPRCGYEIMQTAAPEVMVDLDDDQAFFSNILIPDSYDAVGIGPGISTNDNTSAALKKLLEQRKKPLVIDADALNILGKNKQWLDLLPEQSILTPHPKEFERLAGASSDNFERHRLQLDFAINHKVYVILKGANTCIACPDGSAHFNSTGNPGMATAGSGDVLTGILTGLLAQGYSSLNASLLGVYMHGLAGDIAVKQKSVQGIIAGDIIEALPFAHRELIGPYSLPYHRKPLVLNTK